MLVPGCMSCDILAGRRTPPGGVICEDDYWHVDSVVSPVLWRGFLVVKLKRHCEHLAELKETVMIEPIVTGLAQLVGILLAIDGGFCDERK